MSGVLSITDAGVGSPVRALGGDAGVTGLGGLVLDFSIGSPVWCTLGSVVSFTHVGYLCIATRANVAFSHGFVGLELTETACGIGDSSFCLTGVV